MRRSFLFLFLSFLLSLGVVAGEIRERLALLKDISAIEELSSEYYQEKYLVRITQPVDHKHPEAGSFTQRVVVCHVGLDRPTVVVTEGYGGGYALSPRYREELSGLLNANIVFAEHRYFLESTPEPLNWDYLTAENSAYDLHHIVATLRGLYTGQWISTGISKGGQTTLIYRAFFPDDVAFSVPYVAPLCRGVEDGRHEGFLRKVGTRAERRKIEAFQTEILKRKTSLLPRLEAFCREKELTFGLPIAEILDYCVLEYSFAFWQWGTPVSAIPPLESEDEQLFKHLIDISGPDYFAENQPNGSFFVQAARELGYYGYDVRPFRKYLTIQSAQGYLAKLMLPPGAGAIGFDPALYEKIHHFLKENDPKIIYIYGEIDPWSAAHVPVFKKKKNSHFFFQARGSHRARISNMPEKIKAKILKQLDEWLDKSSPSNEGRL
ncbi:MAG: aminopeptidase [Tannerellaceae bacterium]|jgi:hypothetical protein|nr:aminopeptidase [Tannerellaceae bacterium]